MRHLPHKKFLKAFERHTQHLRPVMERKKAILWSMLSLLPFRRERPLPVAKRPKGACCPACGNFRRRLGRMTNCLIAEIRKNWILLFYRRLHRYLPACLYHFVRRCGHITGLNGPLPRPVVLRLTGTLCGYGTPCHGEVDRLTSRPCSQIFKTKQKTL